MKKIPKMLSTKDLSYISDIFNWNLVASKKIESFIKTCKDDELLKEFEKANKLHLKTCNEMIDLLKEFESNE